MKKSTSIKIAIAVTGLALLIIFSVSTWPDHAASARDNEVQEDTWQRVGLGDCPGRDVGSSEGFTPDAAKAKGGYTAVCWDGIRYNNRNRPGQAFCTYKDIEADKCAGGQNTGVMFKRVQPKVVWQGAGIGDCPGRDVDSSAGFTPDVAKAKAGYTAVCWDGVKYNNRNRPGQAFCTYKNIEAGKCTGGQNTGVMFKGVELTLIWQRAGTGDCPGRDVDSSDGLTPDDKKAKAGYTAVCWDGIRYNNRNRPGQAFCTYKNIPPKNCTGGTNTGLMYEAAAK